MATKALTLTRGKDGYYRTSWYDDSGERRFRKFGKDRNRAYNRFNAFNQRWLNLATVRNPKTSTDLTIAEAWERFYSYAKTYYRRADGTPTGEADNLRVAFELVVKLFGDEPVSEFGAQKLVACRQVMIDAPGEVVNKRRRGGLCVNEINKRVRKIRQVFRWFNEHELVPPATYYALLSVKAIAPGRTKAPVTEEVLPAPDQYVWDVINSSPKPIAAMIQLQYLNASRPGEVCIMRAIDIDMTGVVWIYTPHRHKTQHRKKTRSIPLGPKCQEIIKPFLAGRPVDAYLFSPRETLTEIYDSKATHRHQAVKAPATERRVGNLYTPATYGYFIRRKCKTLGIPHWSPNQLRHNALTRIRKEFGGDVAQVVAGHAHLKTTEVYTELDQQKAKSAMEKVG